MNAHLDSFIKKMAELETEFHGELKSCEARFQSCFVERTSGFNRRAVTIKKKLRSPVFWRNILSVPFIYLMLFPMVFLDAMLLIYQSACFRLYRITLVKRKDHFVIDRQLLSNLNGIDKLNCIYCGYGNGVVSYFREIISKTEQYWCPIKHAQKTLSESERYENFLEYGDTENFHAKRSQYRDKLHREY